MKNTHKLITFILLLTIPCTVLSAQGPGAGAEKGGFSIYAEGGVSTAAGLEFKSVNPPQGIEYSPLVGGGVSYEFARSVRIGLNYDFTKLRRQQRLSELEPGQPTLTNPEASYLGGTAYREFWTHLNSAGLSLEYNFSNLMPALKTAGVNLYLGTGVGYLFAKGNAYVISMSHEESYDLESHGYGELDGDDWVSKTQVLAQNTPHEYRSVYVPATFNAEFVLTDYFTLGLNCGYRYLLTTSPSAPRHLIDVGLILRLTL